MIRIFETGDNHIGLSFDRYAVVKKTLRRSRIDSLSKMIDYANKNDCHFFAITGDLFDKAKIPLKTIKEVVDVLDKFENDVLILPGNHDFYTNEVEVWIHFKDLIKDKLHIHLLNEMKLYTFDSCDKKVVIYPAMCQSKHSKDNNLEWIKLEEIDSTNSYNIGITHGALKGITPDLKNEYFPMSTGELEEINVDAWLIGHTHISYPEIPTEEWREGHRVYNAGTHEQTDLSCNTPGSGFIIEISGDKKIRAKRYISGIINFYDIVVKVKDIGLRNILTKTTESYSDSSILRIKLEGSIDEEDYEQRTKICEEICSRFLAVEILDSELSIKITEDKIKKEFSEVSFPALLLSQFLDNTIELQMVYDLIQNSRD
jgi:DNA repair exonuclease SbcCD nuclease subunit